MIGIVIALLVGVPFLAAVATLLGGGRRQVVVLTSVGGTAIALAMSVLLVLEQPWREGQAFDGVLLSVPPASWTSSQPRSMGYQRQWC